MSENKRVLGSDFRKVDAHEITPEEYDEIPELDDDFFERADLYEGETLIRRGRGRPALEQPKRQVTLRLDADLLDALRATGPGWQTRVNQALREWLDAKAA